MPENSENINYKCDKAAFAVMAKAAVLLPKMLFRTSMHVLLTFYHIFVIINAEVTHEFER